jgi:tetratricopeptide (TPR) repeat protein
MIIPVLAVSFLLSSARAADTASPRARADAHFLSGFDHYRAGRAEDARREWKACREIDETHDFCEFGLSVLDAGAPKPAEPEAAAPASVTEAPPSSPPSQDALAQQNYLEGVIYYQKGDYEKARVAWLRAKELAAPGSESAKDATAGLERINTLYGGAPVVSTQTPQNLKDRAEPKDEHEALQAYFTGLVYYQKGDAVRAKTEWTRALALAPRDSGVESDSKAALAKLGQEEASTRREGKK